jgi:hypothetical protein
LGFAGLAQGLPARGHWQRLLPVAVGTMFVLGIAASAGRSSARNNTVYRDFITSAFTSLAPGSILITSMGDDVTGAVFYFHEVEGLRGDVVHLDSDYLAKPWYTARKRRLHPEVYLPDGGYGSHGWNLKHLLDGNPNRPIVFLGHLDDWDHSWQDGYKVTALGLCRVLVRASEFPDYEAWAARDRLAIGTYDVTPALRAPDESWERALGQRILDAQIGRAHLALLYGYARHDATQPAGFARQLLEDVVAKSGGDEALGIGSWAQVRRLDTSPALWKDLGLAYQALASSDEAYIQKFAISCSRFVARARPDDPDLPAARKYLAERHAPPIHGQAVP